MTATPLNQNDDWSTSRATINDNFSSIDTQLAEKVEFSSTAPAVGDLAVFASTNGKTIKKKVFTPSEVLESDASGQPISAAKATWYNKAFGTTADTILEWDKDATYLKLAWAQTVTGDKTFSGVTTAITQSPWDNSTKIATTAYADVASDIRFTVNASESSNLWYTVYYGDQEMKAITAGTDLAGAYYFSLNSATSSNATLTFSPSGLKGSGSTTILTHALTKDYRIKWVEKYDSNSDVQWIGLAIAVGTLYSAQTDITNGTIRFVNNAGTLYAHNANGTTATSTNISSGLTLTNWNTYEIVVDPGTDVKFYVNGTLKATHTTNLPTTGTPLLWAGVSNNANTRLIAMTPFAISYEL